MTFIRYKKLLFYIQRQIDRLLKLLRDFIKVYINDIIIFFKTLLEYLKHL